MTNEHWQTNVSVPNIQGKYIICPVQRKMQPANPTDWVTEKVLSCCLSKTTFSLYLIINTCYMWHRNHEFSSGTAWLPSSPSSLLSTALPSKLFIKSICIFSVIEWTGKQTSQPKNIAFFARDDKPHKNTAISLAIILHGGHNNL